MSTIQYFPPMFERLTPRTPWAGGRMVDTDVLTLAEAASMATNPSPLAIFCAPLAGVR